MTRSNDEHNNQNEKNNSKCHQCVELLKRVLTTSSSAETSASSRPRALLEALGSSSSCDFTPTENGVVVSFHNEQHNNTTVTSTRKSTVAAGADITNEKSVAAARQPPSSSSSSSSHLSPSDTAAATTIGPQPLAASAATSSSTTTTTVPESEQTTLKIECRPCGTRGPEGGARAFVMGPSPLSIVLCSNRLHSLNDNNNDVNVNKATAAIEEMTQVLTHELVHVYDVKVLKLDLRNCVNLAYSEIRAAREAECADRSWMTQSQCIHKRALEATQNLFPPQQAATCISQAYGQAIEDMRPFQRTQPTTRTSNTSTGTANKK